MKVNRYRPHVLVLPEDDANRQLANGFLLEESLLPSRIQVLDEVGGWAEVLDRFKSDHVNEMDKYPNRFMILLIDFDSRENRLDRAKREIPDRLSERVFILGAWTDPEALRRAIGSFETVGLALAKDCREDTDTIWGHELLRHNATEIDRLRRYVRPILFRPA